MYPPTPGYVPGMTPNYTSAQPNTGGPGSYDAPAAITDPQELIRQTAILAKSQGYSVEPDGRIYKMVNGKKDYFPPWSVWTGPNATPASDPSSPWHFMYQASGPFTNVQQWDASKGTYEGGINWPTLLTAIGVGGMVAAGIAAGGAGGTLTTGVGTTADFSSEAPEIAGALTPGIGTGGTLEGLSTGIGEGAGAISSPVIDSSELAPTAAESADVGAGLPPGYGGIGTVEGGTGAFDASGAWVPTGSDLAPATSSIWDKLQKYVIPGASIAGNLIGAKIGANAAEHGADLQNQYLNRALDLQQKIFDTEQGNLAPYRAYGSSALGELGYRLGLPGATSPTRMPPPLQPPQTASSQAPIIASKIGLPNGSTGQVTLRAPDGSIAQVLSTDVPHYLSLGATLVGVNG